MYFSQQESGQSTLCEHLIGLTAGEDEKEEENWWWLVGRGRTRTEKRKQRHGGKSVSRQNFKFTVSDVDKCISDKMTLDFVHRGGN